MNVRKTAEAALTLVALAALAGCYSAVERAGLSRAPTARLADWLDEDLPGPEPHQPEAPKPVPPPAPGGQEIPAATPAGPATAAATSDRGAPGESVGGAGATLWYPFDQMDPRFAGAEVSSVFGVAASALVPVDHGDTIVKNGAHFTVFYGVDFNRYHRMTGSVGFYRAETEDVVIVEGGVPNVLEQPDLESLTFQVDYQLSYDLPQDLGRAFFVASAGAFYFDKDEVSNRSGDPVEWDLGLKGGIGAEFSSLDFPLRTQFEISYLRLIDLREEFAVFRLSLLMTF